MRRARPALRSALCALLTLVVIPSARAQDDPSVQARQAFDEGVTLLDAHQYTEAAAAFERSLAVRDSPTARYDLALAYRGAHWVRKSIEALRMFLADPSGTPPELVADAAQLLGAQQRLLAHVTLRIDGPAPAAVTVDDGATSPRVTQDLELDPGHHAFSAAPQDGEPVRVERDLTDGERALVVIDLSAATAVGHLTIHADPPTADIALDGRVRAQGTLSADLDPASYRIRVTALGRLPTERRVTLRAHERLGLDLSLASAAPPPADNTWLWIALGLTTVATATLAVILAIALSATTYAPLDSGSTGVVVMSLR